MELDKFVKPEKGQFEKPPANQKDGAMGEPWDWPKNAEELESHIKQRESKAHQIGVFLSEMAEQLAKGVTILSRSIQKSGIMPHLIFLWCVGWGIIGFFFSLLMLFSR